MVLWNRDLAAKILMTSEQEVAFQQLLDAIHKCEQLQIYIHCNREGDIRGYNGENICSVKPRDRVPKKEAVRLDVCHMGRKARQHDRSFNQPFIFAANNIGIYGDLYAFLGERDTVYNVHRGKVDSINTFGSFGFTPTKFNFIGSVDTLPELLELVRSEFGDMDWEEEPEDITASFRYGMSSRYCYSENNDVLYIVEKPKRKGKD